VQDIGERALDGFADAPVTVPMIRASVAARTIMVVTLCAPGRISL
jgi:hypothetical protein